MKKKDKEWDTLSLLLRQSMSGREMKEREGQTTKRVSSKGQWATERVRKWGALWISTQSINRLKLKQRMGEKEKEGKRRRPQGWSCRMEVESGESGEERGERKERKWVHRRMKEERRMKGQFGYIVVARGEWCQSWCFWDCWWANLLLNLP